MPLFDALLFATCFGVLLGAVRFSALAFWPDTPVAQFFQRLQR